MIVTVADTADITEWAALWPDESADHHVAELAAAIDDPDLRGFVASVNGMAAGFAEAAIRHDHGNGCGNSPVAFLEGLYVAPSHRRTRGCSELASDADLANHGSHRMHAALGFAETERVVYFRKPL